MVLATRLANVENTQLSLYSVLFYRSLRLFSPSDNSIFTLFHGFTTGSVFCGKYFKQ